jgi:hypothetical protein
LKLQFVATSGRVALKPVMVVKEVQGVNVPLVPHVTSAPLTINVCAGDKAKLEWVVSLDGKKTQSETYKVLGILDKPKGE